MTYDEWKFRERVRRVLKWGLSIAAVVTVLHVAYGAFGQERPSVQVGDTVPALVICVDPEDAKTALRMAVNNDLDALQEYLEADGNQCAQLIPPVPSVVLEKVGPVIIDAEGREIQLWLLRPAAEEYKNQRGWSWTIRTPRGT